MFYIENNIKMSCNVEKIKPILFSPSEEQQKIIDALKNKQNVIVNAVAGSGKTTTILGIARQMPDVNILQITYNKALQIEVEEKVEHEQLKNIKIYTYHGLACSFYDYTAYTDEKIKKIITDDTSFKPRYNQSKYSIIVIDEAQDMKHIYFKLVYKFLKDINYNVNLLILGDNYQCINEFLDADYRYLTLAEDIFISHKPFVKLTLNTSYRLTNTMARFINEFMMYNKVKINAPKKGEPVIYHRLNTFSDAVIISNYIIDKIMNHNAKADDFFIIAPSVNKSKILKDIENHLVNANIQCYVPMSDDSKLKAIILQNKVVFTTYNQAKGRERPYCIVLGFDTSYYKYYNRKANMKLCENILYVAVSRASKQLILVEDYKQGSHPFLRSDTLIYGFPLSYDVKTFLQMSNASMKKKFMNRDIIEEEVRQKQALVIHTTSVTNFTKFIKNEIIDKITSLVDKLFITTSPVDEQNSVIFPNDIQTSSSTYEEVYDIIGVTLPSMLEINKCGKTNVLHRIAKIEVETMLQDDKHKTIIDEFNKIVYPCVSIRDWLHLGNFYLACTNKLYYKIKQITNYDWITDKIIEGCHNNMRRNIVSFDDLIFEYEQEITFTDKAYGQITLMGRFDAIDSDTIWEFKCVESFSLEHKLQLILYSYMWQLNNNTLIANYNAILMKDRKNRGVNGFDSGVGSDSCNGYGSDKKAIQDKSFSKSMGNRQCKLMNIRTGEVLKLNANNDACLCVIGGECGNCNKAIKQIINLLLENRYFYKEKIDNNEFITKNITEISVYLDAIRMNNVVSGATDVSDLVYFEGETGFADGDDSVSGGVVDSESRGGVDSESRSISDFEDESGDESESRETINFSKLKVNELIELCNKEFVINENNRIKNLKKKKKQELIDILLNIRQLKREDDKRELDF